MTDSLETRPWWRRSSILAGLAAVLVMGIGLRTAHLKEHLDSGPDRQNLMGAAAEHGALSRQIANGYLHGPEHLASDPLYPLVLGAFSSLLGESQSRLAAAQSFLGLLVLVLTFWLGLRVASPEAGVMAAGLLGLYGPLLHFECLALPVTLAMALQLAALVASISGADRTRPLLAGWAGALWGLAVWARPWMLLAPLLSGLSALPGLLRKPLWRVAGPAARAGFVAAGLAIVLTPLFLRNSLSGAAGTLLPARYGLELYVANHPGASGEDVAPPGFTSPRRLHFQEARQRAAGALDRQPASPAETSGHYARLAAKGAAAAPAETMARLGRKALLFAHAEELPSSSSIGPFGERPLAMRLAALPFSLLLALGFFGLAFAGLRGRRWLLASLAAHLLVGLLLPASAEARITLAPILAVAAAAGVFEIASRTRGLARLLPTCALALALGIALALFPLPGSLGRAARTRLEEAQTLLAQGRPWAAREKLGPLYALPTAAARAFHLDGLALQQLGMHRQAVTRLSQALARDPRNAAAQVDTARSYATMADRAAARGDRGAGADYLHEALAHLQRARASAPDAPDELLLSARLLLAMGRRDKARELLLRALALVPDMAEVHTELGILAAMGDKPGEAIAHFALAKLLGARLDSTWEELLETANSPPRSSPGPSVPPPRPGKARTSSPTSAPSRPVL